MVGMRSMTLKMEYAAICAKLKDSKQGKASPILFAEYRALKKTMFTMEALYPDRHVSSTS